MTEFGHPSASDMEKPPVMPSFRQEGETAANSCKIPANFRPIKAPYTQS